MIEDKRFSKGSEAIAKAIFKNPAFAVIGGGETIALLKTKNYKLKLMSLFPPAEEQC